MLPIRQPRQLMDQVLTPRFEQLVARVNADLAAMRAKADFSGLP
jgi:hypothetical protein